ncbi:DNA methyltransferase [Amycolatopsis sp., V23-08]|uniref:DNA methyltransferase n=1 Tax=Amycolatopsis heterodermiae TaxID=3110235 RepID=A0ABU5RJW3_9PSEU|nr:DNA methyltransferase [Amycolatopsis sp., V23-08]MEA5365421.1 DNA methyltransferase [Amycolatopsis sp., V23-08]
MARPAPRRTSGRSRPTAAGRAIPPPARWRSRDAVSGSAAAPAGRVLDPFSGSGTTGLAAREQRCRFIGADLNPACHNLALRRLGLGR